MQFKAKEGFALVFILLLLLRSFFFLARRLGSLHSPCEDEDEDGVAVCTHAHWLENTFRLFTRFSLKAKP